MYNAPSGLAIYFITNSTIGILEGRWIRAHIDQLDLDKKVEEMASEGRKKVANKASAPQHPMMGKSKGRTNAQKPTRKKRK
jgi:membrane protein insertase Oxa1/YidC/SpoIIIJ